MTRLFARWCRPLMASRLPLLLGSVWDDESTHFGPVTAYSLPPPSVVSLMLLRVLLATLRVLESAGLQIVRNWRIIFQTVSHANASRLRQ